MQSKQLSILEMHTMGFLDKSTFEKGGAKGATESVARVSIEHSYEKLSKTKNLYKNLAKPFI